MRCDISRPYREKVPGVREDHYTDMQVWGDEERSTYSTQRFADGSKVVLDVRPRETVLKGMPDHKIPIFDVRVLGFLTTGLLAQGDIGKLIGHPERSNLSMVDETLEGIPCKKICFVILNAKKNPVKNSFWIAPEMGYSVIQNESSRDRFRSYTKLVVKEYRNTGLWFPVSSISEALDDGKRLTYEKLTIDVLSLNEPLDAKYFTIGNLNVLPGTRVTGIPTPDNVKLIWDGKEITPAQVRH